MRFSDDTKAALAVIEARVKELRSKRRQVVKARASEVRSRKLYELSGEVVELETVALKIRSDVWQRRREGGGRRILGGSPA